MVKLERSGAAEGQPPPRRQPAKPESSRAERTDSANDLGEWRADRVADLAKAVPLRSRKAEPVWEAVEPRCLAYRDDPIVSRVDGP